MKNKIILFWVIVTIAIACLGVIIKKPTSLGLDLVGGSRLTLEAQTSATIKKNYPRDYGLTSICY